MNTKLYTCEECGAVFINCKLKANHVRWHHKDNTGYLENAREAAIKVNNRRFGVWIEEDIKCMCGKEMLHIKYRKDKKKEKYYCKVCCHSQSFSRTPEIKYKISEHIKKLWASGHYDKTSALNYLITPKQFSSKVEREIVKYFKTTYPDDGWKSGGSLKIGDLRISRDLWSDELKICFEYDGDWHFKDIHDQLRDKQRKDRKLAKWCRENGYRLIRIDERSYQNITQVEKLIYQRKGKIIKIGNRY